MNARQPHCPCCDSSSVDRRQFLHRTGQSALALGAAAYLAPLTHAADPAASGLASAAKSPESLVKLLYESFSPGQREKVCFPWEHKHADWGLLRTRVSANWLITDETLNSDFYKPEQRELITAIFRGIISPEWHERFDTQQYDDGGGFGENNSIAIFGTPGQGQSELVLTGRHMTLRCDGDSAEHVAFGGPIFYGHDPTGTGTDAPTHEGNVFWPQAAEANKLYEALDGKQQKLALVKDAPGESDVPFRGKDGKFDGIPVSELSADQKERVQEVLRKLIEPYRQTDRDEVVKCLKAQGGIDACHLAFYQEGNLGKDQTWDIWRLEGPSFVWHWRGSPHVHVWVNVASDPSVKLNA